MVSQKMFSHCKSTIILFGSVATKSYLLQTATENFVFLRSFQKKGKKPLCNLVETRHGTSLQTDKPNLTIVRQ